MEKLDTSMLGYKSTLKMETVSSANMLAFTYQIMLHHPARPKRPYVL